MARKHRKWALATIASIAFVVGMNCDWPGEADQPTAARKAKSERQAAAKGVRGIASLYDADQARQPGAPGGYMALILTVEKYKAFPPLRHPHASGDALADELKGLKYQVTHLRDGQVTKAATLAWLAKVKTQQPELAFVAISGHGVLRSDKEVFMTVNATRKSGGIPLEAIGKQVAEDGLPVIGIYDCCRRGPPNGVPSEPTNSTDDQARGLAPVPISTHGRTGMTWLHATQRHDVVLDSRHDLLSSLADGLLIDKASNRFQALTAQSLFRVLDSSHTGDLTVLEWFLFGAFRVSIAQSLEQSPNLAGKGQELSGLIVAHSDPPGPGPKRKNLVSSASGEDLLRVFRPHHGSYRWEPLHGEVGLRIFRNRADNPHPYLAGYVTHRQEGLSTTGKALFLELAVRTNPFGAKPSDTAAIGIDAKYVDPPRRDEWINVGGQKSRLTLPVNRMVWVRIDLMPNQQLNYIGWSDLPPGTSLDVRRVRLAASSLAHPAGGVGARDLLGSWWVSNTGRGDDDLALTWSGETVDGKRVLRIGSGTGWIGGLVAPERFVYRDNVVEVEIENLSRREASVVFELKNGYEPIGSSTMRLPPGRSTHTVIIERDSILDFMTVHGPTAAIRILGVTSKEKFVPLFRER